MPGTAVLPGPARKWGLAAAAWCVVFAALHVYWAVGGAVGLAESAGPDLAERRPTAFVLLGLWGTAVELLVGAALGTLLARSPAAGPVRRLIGAAGWLIGGALLARGAVFQAVLLTDTGGIASAVGTRQTAWSLALWNPWFIVGGVMFLGAAFGFRRGRS